MIHSFYFGDSSIANQSKVQITQRELKIDYPCVDSSNCTYVSFELPKGTYFFELAGASSGILTSPYNEGLQSQVDSTQAGGIVSGTITFRKTTNVFAHVGGKGKVEKNVLILKGGYNGGGSAEHQNSYHGTPGGGGTDIRTEVNDVWHRILVAGGGGGGDDENTGALSTNDGAGGAGGGTTSQSFKVQWIYQEGYEANQTSGFSFFQGERGSPQKSNHPNGYPNFTKISEQSGAGGGWFGGFSSHCNYGGSSGGSSFALTLDAEIPSESIPLYDDKYNFIDSKPYAYYPSSSPYLFKDVVHQRGIWYGNGYVHIKLIKPGSQFFACYYRIQFIHSLFFVIYLLK